MKKSIYLIILVTSALMAVACQKEDEPQIKLSKDSVVCPVAASEHQIPFTANYDWIAFSSTSWIHLVTSSGAAGDSNLHFNVDEGVVDERTGFVIISCRELRDTITVTQVQLDRMMLKEHLASFGSEGGTYVATVSTNVEFDVDISADWIKREGVKGLVDRSFPFRCMANESYDDREANIVFTSKDGMLKDTLYVFQDRFRKMELSDKNIEVKAGGTTFSIKVNANVDYDIIIKDDAKWVSRISTKGLKEDEISFECAPNEDYDRRETAVIFMSKERDLVDSLRVCQAAKSGLFANPDTLSIDYAGGRETVSLRYNVKYDISSDSDWLTVQEVPATKGLEEKQYTIMVSEYTDMDKGREGHITFKSDKLSAVLTVVQSPKPIPVLGFSHDRKTTGVPYISGEGVSGTIDWGDGQSDSFINTKTHSYSKNSTYTVTITVKYAETVEFEGIDDISSIDFSLF